MIRTVLPNQKIWAFSELEAAFEGLEARLRAMEADAEGLTADVDALAVLEAGREAAE